MDNIQNSTAPNPQSSSRTEHAKSAERKDLSKIDKTTLQSIKILVREKPELLLVDTSIKQNLKDRLEELKGSTGWGSWFISRISSKSRKTYQQNVEFKEELSRFIAELRIAESKVKEKAKQALEAQQKAPQSKRQSEKASNVKASQVELKSVPLSPEDIEASVAEEEGGIPDAPPPPDDSSIPDAPPPPDDSSIPDAPPPPPMLGTSTGAPTALKIQKKPEPTLEELKQKHEADEKKRLVDEAKARANPDFYKAFIPPEDKELRPLERQEVKLTEEIEEIMAILANDQLPANVRTQMEKRLGKKQAELDSVKTAIRGQEKPLRNLEDPGFAEKLAQLTDEELQVIVGMIFKGQKPEQDSPEYSRYSPAVIPAKDGEKSYEKAQREQSELKSRITKEALDDIFNRWSTISKSNTGLAFIGNEKEWEKYLGVSKGAFIETLVKRAITKEAAQQNRALNPKDKNYAVGAVHTARPFEPPKKRAPVVIPKSEGQPDRGALFSAIRGGAKLKSVEDRKDKPQEPVKEETNPTSIVEELQKKRGPLKSAAARDIKPKEDKSAESIDFRKNLKKTDKTHLEQPKKTEEREVKETGLERLKKIEEAKRQLKIQEGINEAKKTGRRVGEHAKYQKLADENEEN